MSLLGIIILVIIILFAILGMKKGLIRKVSGVLSLLIACLLVNFLLPYVSTALKEHTPIYGFLVQRCEELVNTQAAKLVTSDALKDYAVSMGISPEQLDAVGGNTEDIKNALSQMGVATSDLGMTLLKSLSRTEQTSLIRSLPVPGFVQKMIESYNNSEGYRKLDASDFGQYLVRFIADLIMNVIAFLATMIVTWILVRLFIGSLHLFSNLPVLGAADRVGGLLCGALEGVFVVWILLMIVSLFSGTAIGSAIESQLDKSLTLWPLAESNIFLKIISNAVSKML